MIASRRQGESSPLAPRKEKGAEAMPCGSLVWQCRYPCTHTFPCQRRGSYHCEALAASLLASTHPRCHRTHTLDPGTRLQAAAWKFRSECPTADGPEKPHYTSCRSPRQGCCLRQDLVVCSGNAARQRDMPVRDETSFSAPGSCSWSGMLGSMRSVCPRCVRE